MDFAAVGGIVWTESAPEAVEAFVLWALDRAQLSCLVVADLSQLCSFVNHMIALATVVDCDELGHAAHVSTWLDDPRQVVCF